MHEEMIAFICVGSVTGWYNLMPPIFVLEKARNKHSLFVFFMLPMTVLISALVLFSQFFPRFKNLSLFSHKLYEAIF